MTTHPATTSADLREALQDAHRARLREREALLDLVEALLAGGQLAKVRAKALLMDFDRAVPCRS